MGTKAKTIAAMYGMMAMGMMGGMPLAMDMGLDDIKPSIPFEPMPVIPKGCKEYFFNVLGEFSTERMLKTEMVFKCFASNDKNARRKFDKFMKNNSQNT